MVHVVYLALVLLAGLQPQSDQDTGVTVQEVSRARATAAGQPIELPRGGLEVIASIYTIAPGAALPVHKHRYPRYAFVLSGTAQVTAEDGRVFTYAAGEFIVEMFDAWHRGSNPGDVPARLLVIDQVEAGGANVEMRNP